MKEKLICVGAAMSGVGVSAVLAIECIGPMLDAGLAGWKIGLAVFGGGAVGGLAVAGLGYAAVRTVACIRQRMDAYSPALAVRSAIDKAAIDTVEVSVQPAA